MEHNSISFCRTCIINRDILAFVIASPLSQTIGTRPNWSGVMSGIMIDVGPVGILFSDHYGIFDQGHVERGRIGEQVQQ